jgi:predicted transcriptional regulator
MANRAIIGVAPKGRIFSDLRELARKVDRGEAVPEADYELSFVTAAQLFSELTPARLVLLEALKRSGPLSIYALAKGLKRNYSNVHRDVGKLLEYGLVAKDAEGRVYVPWDEVLIRLSARSAA